MNSGGDSQWRPGAHVPPRIIDEIKKCDILPLKRVKFEMFAGVIG